MIPSTSMIFASKMEENILSLMKSHYLQCCGSNVQTEQKAQNLDSPLAIACAMGVGGPSSLSHIFLVVSS